MGEIFAEVQLKKVVFCKVVKLETANVCSHHPS